MANLTINQLFTNTQDVAKGGGTIKTFIDIMSTKFPEQTAEAIKRAAHKSPTKAKEDYWGNQYTRLRNELTGQVKKARETENASSLAYWLKGQKLTALARRTGGTTGISKADQISELASTINAMIAAEAAEKEKADKMKAEEEALKAKQEADAAKAKADAEGSAS